MRKSNPLDVPGYEYQVNCHQLYITLKSPNICSCFISFSVLVVYYLQEINLAERQLTEIEASPVVSAILLLPVLAEWGFLFLTYFYVYLK